MADGKTLTNVTWEDYYNQPTVQRAQYLLEDDGLESHVLLAQQFDRKRLEELGHLATCIRRIAKSEEGMKYLRTVLSHKRAMLYFSQPSSRTFLSFCAACQILGMQIGEVRDPSVSSEYKGETRQDSVRTFSSYFDLIIMRSEQTGLAEEMSWALSNSERPVPIVNAGSGRDQHPTQALLDIYTLQRSFEDNGGIDGKTVLFVGDLARGRTVRSLAFLLTAYKDVKQIFVAPKSLQISEDILQLLDDAGVEYEVADSLKDAMPKADAIYMTRIQWEWDVDGESKHLDISDYSITTEEMKLMKKDAVLMHPFPRKGEIEGDVDHDPRAVYWRQMRNGMWVRAALIASLFRKDKKILEYFDKADY